MTTLENRAGAFFSPKGMTIPILWVYFDMMVT
jgi:hypothetical protein